MKIIANGIQIEVADSAAESPQHAARPVVLLIMRGNWGELGSEQNYYDVKRKLSPAIAARTPFTFSGFQASNQPPAPVNIA